MPTWDAKDVAITVGGALIEGFASGSVVNVAYSADKYSLMVGADGESCRSKINDESADITISLLPTSLSNAILDSWMKADEATNQGRFPLSITHIPTGTGFVAPSAWVKKDPGQDMQAEIQPKAWTLHTAKLKSKHTGSVDPF